MEKIHPQRDKIPVYNPNGRYWVKLYHMGKLRRIEIDDMMPCSIYDEFCLPRTEKLEELWPAIITKALIKLYSYKNHSGEEIGDCAPFYALTGYIGERIFFPIQSGGAQGQSIHSSVKSSFKFGGVREMLEDEIEKMKLLENALKDDFYQNKQKILLCFRSYDRGRYDSAGENNLNKFKLKKEEKDIPSSENSHTIESNKSIKRSSERHNSVAITGSGFNNKLKQISSFDVRNQSNSPSTRDLLNKMKTLKPTGLTNISEAPIKKSPYIAFSSMNVAKVEKDFSKRNSQGFSLLNLANKMFPNENEKFEGKILFNCLYSLVELFDNRNFNMKRLQPLDFNDLKQRIQELKINYKQLTKEEKKAYILKVKDVKHAQKEEKQQRIEELKSSGKRLYFIKVRNNAMGCGNKLDFYCPYTDEEILMTKKCLLNNWDFPPPFYFEKNHVTLDKLSDANNLTMVQEYNNTMTIIRNQRKADSIVNSDMNISDELFDRKEAYGNNKVSGWSKDVYMQLINNNLDQYIIAKEPLQRESGVWLSISEFNHFFNNFIILHNPKFYKNKVLCDNTWQYYNTDIFEVDQEKTVFHLHPDEYYLMSGNANNKFDQNNSCLTIMFNPNMDEEVNFKDVEFYACFELRSKSGDFTEYITLTSYFHALQYDMLSRDEEYFLILRGGLFPVGFYMKILSDHNITNMSYSNYLLNFNDFKKFSFTIDYQPLEAVKFQMLTKFKLKVKVI